MANLKLRLIKAIDMTPMPWKNGGGTTSEVAISPANASVAGLDFDWRVSIATIGADGPFSQFEGYDRQLVVWKGEGLQINDEFKASNKPFQLRGEDSTDAKLTEGPVKDIGVIFKRGEVKAELGVKSAPAESITTHIVRGECFILCGQGELRIDEFYLNPGDVVHAQGEGELAITALDQARIIACDIAIR